MELWHLAITVFIIVLFELLFPQVKKDAGTGRSRGFGFVRFFDVNLQQKIFNMQHTIKGRRVDLRYPRRVCAVSGF